mmetsp:Transcript_44003/g.138303  ORF Transcript_44003/g.138303 Transcript_44003/m.138303 type:complete len:252 (-) Transcript_44003:426-1181(-)
MVAPQGRRNGGAEGLSSHAHGARTAAAAAAPARAAALHLALAALLRLELGEPQALRVVQRLVLLADVDVVDRRRVSEVRDVLDVDGGLGDGVHLHLPGEVTLLLDVLDLEHFEALLREAARDHEVDALGLEDAVDLLQRRLGGRLAELVAVDRVEAGLVDNGVELLVLEERVAHVHLHPLDGQVRILLLLLVDDHAAEVHADDTLVAVVVHVLGQRRVAAAHDEDGVVVVHELTDEHRQRRVRVVPLEGVL